MTVIKFELEDNHPAAGPIMSACLDSFPSFCGGRILHGGNFSRSTLTPKNRKAFYALLFKWMMVLGGEVPIKRPPSSRDPWRRDNTRSPDVSRGRMIYLVDKKRVSYKTKANQLSLYDMGTIMEFDKIGPYINPVHGHSCTLFGVRLEPSIWEGIV